MAKIKIKIQIIINLIITLIPYIICDINIHIIPHTHLDPGWLKTPEDYYQTERVYNIFDTILSELSNSKEKTFVINEIYYFKIWYSDINEEKKLKLKELIKQKRIEFVSGSFTINDEANPLYYNIIDQIRIGHQFLLEEFGIIPKTAWYIDSFGHSAGNGHILTQLKFKYLVLGRMHIDFLELMKNETKIEFYWKPFGNQNSNKKILTHVLPLHYGFTQYMDFLGKNNELFRASLKHNIYSFINNIKEAMRGLRHNNIMFLYGDDFHFQDNKLFANIDSLINSFDKYNIDTYRNIKAQFRTNGNVNIFYSTPEKYFNAVKKELKAKNRKLGTYSNIDFYPLRTDCFWTGYFTSRPYLKGYIRKGSNIFYSLSKYFSYDRLIYENIDENIIKNLNKFRSVVGLTQHHDAITGTST